MTQTLLTAAADVKDVPSTAFVCFFGVAVVFAGLVILIGLVYLLNLVSDKLLKDKAPAKSVAPVATATASDVIPNREELVAAVCAAIAEEEGTDISAIRVVSIKKV